MLKRPRSDFWQVGILRSPLARLDAGHLAAQREAITWLPDPGDWRYLADPFGLRRGDALHVFVEAYDYRHKHAVIERHELDAQSLAWRGKATVLARPFHLSYPFVLTHEEQVYMVPESHQAGEIALYHGSADLNTWHRVGPLLSGMPGAEPSLIQHQGRWWLFFTLVGPGARDQRELHLAHAPDLYGPWTLHPLNPVLSDRSGARPGGTPFVHEGQVMLPVQDCSQGYGAALRLLCFEQLTESQVLLRHTPMRLEGSLVSERFHAGFHTLAGAGEFCLFDVKRVDRRRQRQWLDLQRRWRRLLGRAATLPPQPATQAP